MGGIGKTGAALAIALAALVPVWAQANSYRIIAPPVVGCGAPFWITVVALDAVGDTKTDYCGTTSFTSTDPGATFQFTPMDFFNYTWSSSIAPCGLGGDDGVKLFVNAVLPLPGTQTITAVDTIDGAMTDAVSIMVVCADVKLWGSPASVLAGSNQTVRFRACWSNYSTGSAFTFVLTDAVPMGTTFVPEASVAALDGGNTSGVALTVGSSLDASATPPPPASFVDGNPPAGARWLRWTVPLVGTGTTGCGCFRVRVD